MGIRIKKEEDELAAANAEQAQKDALTSAAPTVQATVPGAATGAEPKGSGQFVNLNKFIEANKGVDGQVGKSEQFAGNVAKGAEEKGNKALNTLEKEISTAASAFTAATPTYTPGSLNANSSLADIQGLSNAANVSTEEEGIFNKPFESAAGKSEIEAAAKNIGQTTDLGGLANVVQDYYGSKGLKASTGEKAFDTLLTGRDTGAQEKFTKLRGWADTALTPAYDKAFKDVGDLGTAGLNASRQTATDVRNAAQVAGTGILSPLEEQAKVTNTAALDRINEWNRTHDNAAQYVTQGGPATAMSQATIDQIARLNALATLRGTTTPGYAQETYTGPTIDEAGYAKDRAEAAAAQQAYVDSLPKQMAIIPEPVQETPVAPTPMPSLEAGNAASTIASLPAQTWDDLIKSLTDEELGNIVAGLITAPISQTESALGLPSTQGPVRDTIAELTVPTISNIQKAGNRIYRKLGGR